MNVVQVRNLVFGEGRPKICVPIVGRTREEIRKQMGTAKASGADLAEWRADWYEGTGDPEKLAEILEDLREGLGEFPLLVTFRSAGEGGEQEISAGASETFLWQVLDLGKADLLDVEFFMGEKLLSRVCRKARGQGVKVVASSHDFQKTPPREEMLERLKRMQEAGADLLKIAVMPGDPGDVLTLLSVSWEMKSRYARQPLIAISMGALGAVSRISGEIFGSAMTFGTAGQASAPGQISVEELQEVHRVIGRKR